jgi:hypothetical protein
MFTLMAIAEPTSAIICFILVWFMAKPYRITGENSFLGLPIGFAIMGVSHVIATTVAFSNDLAWFMLLFRTFSFAFIATAYFFSSKTLKKTQYLINITLSSLIVGLIVLSLEVFVAPQSVWENYNIAQIYCRVFIEIFLLYIIAFTINNHIKRPDPATLWIPFGFIFLAISQYSFLFWYLDYSVTALWSAIAFRIIGLLLFLVISYRTFHSSKEAE